tara:strand:- start:26 stop:412 length:387 start_codon:yes stop_codon:yes gene_type:complete
MKINTPISCGELVDKITILKIKKIKIIDEDKLREINKELEYLNSFYLKLLKNNPQLSELFDNLYKINLDLWQIEDEIRICEKNKSFDDNFINLARAVYQRNDARFKIKTEINELLGSDIKEQKSYEKY